MSTLSTHILDISTGKPAQGVTVRLEQDAEMIATGVTNAQGRITEFVPLLPAGRYRLVAETGAGLAKRGATRSIPARKLIF